VLLDAAFEFPNTMLSPLAASAEDENLVTATALAASAPMPPTTKLSENVGVQQPPY
jgi:hypothetical protein